MAQLVTSNRYDDRANRDKWIVDKQIAFVVRKFEEHKE